jgi:hypothetical protein
MAQTFAGLEDTPLLAWTVFEPSFLDVLIFDAVRSFDRHQIVKKTWRD